MMKGLKSLILIVSDTVTEHDMIAMLNHAY